MIGNEVWRYSSRSIMEFAVFEKMEAVLIVIQKTGLHLRVLYTLFSMRWRPSTSCCPIRYPGHCGLAWLAWIGSTGPLLSKTGIASEYSPRYMLPAVTAVHHSMNICESVCLPQDQRLSWSWHVWYQKIHFFHKNWRANIGANIGEWCCSIFTPKKNSSLRSPTFGKRGRYLVTANPRLARVSINAYRRLAFTLDSTFCLLYSLTEYLACEVPPITRQFRLVKSARRFMYPSYHTRMKEWFKRENSGMAVSLSALLTLWKRR